MTIEQIRTTKTFAVSGSNGLDYMALRAVLTSAGFTEIELRLANPRIAGFLSIAPCGPKWDPVTFGYLSHVKSMLAHNDDRGQILDKLGLYKLLQATSPDICEDHVMPTRPLDEVQTVEPHELLIIKPCGNTKAIIQTNKELIQIVDSTESLQAARAALAAAGVSRAVVCEYVREPWWLEEDGQARKCSVQMYLLVCGAKRGVDGQQLENSFAFWPRGIIQTAVEGFRLEQFDNKNIHVSNRVQSRRLYFPRDLGAPVEVEADILQQMSRIASAVGSLLSRNAESYCESTNAFEVFGLDFLISHASASAFPRVVFLGITTHPDFQRNYTSSVPDAEPDFVEFSSAFWHWVYSQGVKPFFEKVAEEGEVIAIASEAEATTPAE